MTILYCLHLFYGCSEFVTIVGSLGPLKNKWLQPSNLLIYIYIAIFFHFSFFVIPIKGLGPLRLAHVGMAMGWVYMGITLTCSF